MSLGDLLRRLDPSFAKILASFRIPVADGEDLVQNVAIQFLRKQRQVRTPESWLRGAMRNECRMYWRTRSRRRTVAVEESILELIAGPDPADPEQTAIRQGLFRFIDTLENSCRSLLRMRFKLGMDVHETAKRTPYKLSSIDKTIKRCVDKLTRKIAAAGLSVKRRK